MADAIDPAELLDVDVDHLARMLALVKAHWFARLQRINSVEPERLRMRLTVAGDSRSAAAICLPVWRARRSVSTCATSTSGVGRCRRCGRELRSRRPARPSRW